MMTLFAFEPAYFEAEGLATTFVGNPTLNRDLSAADPSRWRRAVGVAEDQPILLVLPGSRGSELRRILPAFEDAAMRLKDRWPRLEIAVLAADTVAGEVKAHVARWRHRAHVVEGEAEKLDAMRAGTVAITKSGTATTELALAGCPMVVGYRAHPATALVARALMQVRFLTLFNIAAGEAIAPELLQERCNGPELAAAVGALLEDPERRRAQAAAQTAALAKLGANLPDPFGAAADVVIRLLQERANPPPPWSLTLPWLRHGPLPLPPSGRGKVRGSDLGGSPPVDRVDPGHVFRLLHRLDVEVDHHRLVVAAHQHALQGLVGRGVDLLVRHVRRHIDEVAGPGLGGEFQLLAPAHPGAAADHIDHALQRSVVMRAGLGAGVDVHRAGPQLLRPDPGEVDRRRAVHAERLGRVGVERAAGDDPDAGMLPVVGGRFGWGISHGARP
jgi:hypothetical protein